VLEAELSGARDAQAAREHTAHHNGAFMDATVRADAARAEFIAATRAWVTCALQDITYRRQLGLNARDAFPRLVDIMSAMAFDAIPSEMTIPTSFDLSITSARRAAT